MKKIIHLVSKLYTWFPFTNDQCRQCKELSFLDTWRDEQNGQFQYDRNLFPQKIPNTFSKCPLIYNALGEFYKERSIIEWIILNSTFTSINVTLIDSDNETYTDAHVLGLGAIAYDLYYRFSNDSALDHISITQPHIYSDLKIYVHCPKKHVLYGNFHKVFNSSLWVLFFVTCIISSMVNYIMHKSIRIELPGFREISYNFYFIWSILTSISVPKIPKTTRVRLLFLLLACYALIMSTIFQSFFTSFLTEPVMERGITNIEELIRKNITVLSELETGSVAFLFMYIGGYLTLNYEGIRIQNSNIPIEKFLNIENSAVITTEMDMKLKISNRMRLEKPCYFNVMRSFESGLFIKLLDDYASSDRNINGTLTRDNIGRYQQEEYFVIDLKHLRIVFPVYLFGIAVSIFVFIFEIVSFKIFKYSSV
ncbi:hypothetical protein L9F63_022082 [Diploptera punctata]|uniref:Ionotropic glutamate receptor C-terminal domain-containing protein n=1 Tax=Diploptera punctata TaxID=6984 RepID=A0AAD8EB57_DIPPU|nr:hypothetical protein L9F63_022082 [Diploptera punctata]